MKIKSTTAFRILRDMGTDLILSDDEVRLLGVLNPIMIKYIKGDATSPTGEGPKVIVHICNDIGKWGRGFVVAVSRRWPEPEQAYRNWYRNWQYSHLTPLQLGAVQFVKVTSELWVANMIGQHGVGLSDPPPVRYSAIRSGLNKVREFCLEHKASVHAPRLGCGLAGGEWYRVENLLLETLVGQGVPVTVYDLA